MLTVVFSWIILFVIFLSFGEMGTSLWNTLTHRNDSYSTIDKFWIGICFLGTLLLYISIFAPLNILMLGGIILIATIFIGLKRRVFIKQIQDLWIELKATSTIQKIIFILAFFAVLIYSLSTPLIYDQGLYHLQSMQWAEQYPTILGLGNLHGRFGFNSSFLLLTTVFNYHPESYFTTFTLNSLSLFVFSFWVINQIGISKYVGRIIALSIVLILSLFTLGANASSSSTDILPSIFMMYLLLRWVLVDEKNFATRKPFLIAIMSIFCVTLKLSSAIVLLTLVICLVLLLKKKDRKTFFCIIALGALVAIPWLTRFIMLTGYLAYPFPTVDIFSFDWKIPVDMVVAEKDAAYAWARVPDLDASVVLRMSITEWIPLWAKRVSWYALGLYSFALITPLFILLFWKKIEPKVNILIWSVAYWGVLFTIFTAPDVRFAFGFLLATITLPFVIFFSNSKKSKLQLLLKKVVPFALAIGIVGLSIIAFNQVKHYSDDLSQLFVKPLPIDTKYKKVNIQYTSFSIGNTTIFVPQGSNQCIDQALPCIPYVNTNLEMRGDNIQDGFRVKKE